MKICSWRQLKVQNMSSFKFLQKLIQESHDIDFKPVTADMLLLSNLMTEVRQGTCRSSIFVYCGCHSRRPPPFGRAATGCLISVILCRVSTFVFNIHSFYNLPIHTQQETTYLIQVQLSFYCKITTTITTTISTKLHNLNYRTGLTHKLLYYQSQ